ncbi:hypothetical protein RN001_009072 [Aquatica leii]|uniref:Uncharacterized protein n=1 Tax=Aquatica leii TaxID=1421715 RepID=A0AAN7P732_9COLE|nr:hypothetical protein RN001_009072 [Aquatica leii]
MMAWILRFAQNCKRPYQKQRGELSFEEQDAAETFIFKLVQKEAFSVFVVRVPWIIFFFNLKIDFDNIHHKINEAASAEDFTCFGDDFRSLLVCVKVYTKIGDAEQ